MIEWRMPSRLARCAALLVAGASLHACDVPHDRSGGAVVVTLSAATPAAWFDVDAVAVRLTPGDYTQFFRAGRDGLVYKTQVHARFHGLDAERAYQVVLPDRFVHDPITIQPRENGTVVVDVPVLLRTGIPRGEPGADPEKVFYVDTTASSDAYVLSWRLGGVKLNEQRVPRDLDQLVSRVATEHSVHGSHLDPEDPAFDQAVVIAPANAHLGALRPLVEALGRVMRPSRAAAPEAKDRPVFQIRVARPADVAIHAPAGAPSRASAYEGPEPTVSLNTPAWMNGTAQQTALDEAIPGIVDCYKHSLTTNPRLQKTFDVLLDVDVDGRVPKASVPRDDQRDRVSFCSAQAFRGLRFTGVKHGYQLVVEVVLSLAGGGT